MAGANETTAALIAAGAALVVAVISWFSARAAEQAVKRNQSELSLQQRALKRLEFDLDGRLAEHNARRDYEYEARKRLYQECAPLLFQLAEQADAAVERIVGLAQAAAQGNLGGGQASWLGRNRYYRRSTHYRLLAPLATIRLLQQRLTHLDLSLDTNTHLVYLLSRQALRVLADDFELARLGRALPYEPHLTDSASRRAEEPARLWQQGVPRGILDNAIEAMLVRGQDSLRMVSFLEFERGLLDPESELSNAIGRIDYLVDSFHPLERPVLWRVLLSMHAVLRAIGILCSRDRGTVSYPSFDELIELDEAQRSKFDWRADASQASDDLVLTEPFDAVRSYMRKTLEQALRAAVRQGSGTA